MPKLYWAACLVLCFSLPVTSLAADSLGKKALQDAIALLESRLKRVSKAEDVAQVKEGIAQLRAVLSPPAADVKPRDPRPDDIVELSERTATLFFDNTAKFRGKTIRVVADIWQLPTDADTLREAGEEPIVFMLKGEKSTSAKISISIPSGMEVPNAAFHDEVWITFQCQNGELKTGNKMVAVRRK